MPQINVPQILFNYPSFLNTDQFKGMVVENNIENTAPYELPLNEKKKKKNPFLKATDTTWMIAS